MSASRKNTRFISTPNLQLRYIYRERNCWKSANSNELFSLQPVFALDEVGNDYINVWCFVGQK